MGYAELIHQRLQTLPLEKQAEVYDFVEFIAARGHLIEALDEDQRKKQVMAALVAARGTWPRMDAKQIDQLATTMRAEWGVRGWESTS